MCSRGDRNETPRLIQSERLAVSMRLIRERAQVDHPLVYVSSAENAPEGAIVIERTFVDPPDRPELPVIAEEPSGKDVFGGQEKRRWQIDHPRLGIA